MIGCAHDGTRFEVAVPLRAPRALTKKTSQPLGGVGTVKRHLPIVLATTTRCRVVFPIVTVTTTRSLTRQPAPTTQYGPVPEIRTVAFCTVAADPTLPARSAIATTSTSATRLTPSVCARPTRGGLSRPKSLQAQYATAPRPVSAA